jgi:hypothetical protein
MGQKQGKKTKKVSRGEGTETRKEKKKVRTVSEFPIPNPTNNQKDY